jgi:hypothetical protein
LSVQASWRFDINNVYCFMAAAQLALATALLAAADRSIATAPSLFLKLPFEILAPQTSPLANDLGLL